MFSTQVDNCNPFVHTFYIILLFSVELEESKIGIWGEGLRRKLENLMIVTDVNSFSAIRNDTRKHVQIK